MEINDEFKGLASGAAQVVYDQLREAGEGPKAVIVLARTEVGGHLGLYLGEDDVEIAQAAEVALEALQLAYEAIAASVGKGVSFIELPHPPGQG